MKGNVRGKLILNNVIICRKKKSIVNRKKKKVKDDKVKKRINKQLINIKKVNICMTELLQEIDGKKYNMKILSMMLNDT